MDNSINVHFSYLEIVGGETGIRKAVNRFLEFPAHLVGARWVQSTAEVLEDARVAARHWPIIVANDGVLLCLENAAVTVMREQGLEVFGTEAVQYGAECRRYRYKFGELWWYYPTLGVG